MDITPAQRFKQLREHLGLTQKEFAEALGVKQTYISAIEVGNRDVSNNILKKLFELYEVSSDWLRYNKGELNTKRGTTYNTTNREKSGIEIGKKVPFHEVSDNDDEDFSTSEFPVSKETEIRARSEGNFIRKFEKEIKEKHPELEEISHILTDLHTYLGDVHYIYRRYLRKDHKFDLHYFREQNIEKIDYQDYLNKKTQILESYLKYREMLLKLLPALHEFYTEFKEIDTTGFGEDLEDELPLSFIPNI